jgi:hypothetical protein
VNGEVWSSERYDREAQQLYERGEWESARRLLRQGISDHPEDPTMSMDQFMRAAASIIHRTTGATVPDDDSVAFIRGSEAGALRIGR